MYITEICVTENARHSCECSCAEQFRKALDLMNRAVTAPGQSMAHQPGAVESVSYLTNLEQTSSVTPPPTQRVRETRYEVCKIRVINFTEMYIVCRGINKLHRLLSY